MAAVASNSKIMKPLFRILPFFLVVIACQNSPEQTPKKIKDNTTTAVKSTTNKAEELNAFVLPKHEILDSKRGDLNNDGREDVLLILKAIDEHETSDIDNPSPRPLLLLTRQADHSLVLAKRNDHSVLCVNCGGVMGDPYSNIVIKGNYFSIEHMGGSSDRWTKIVTYKYEEEEKDWLLHKDGGESFSSIDPDQVKTVSVKGTKDFGKVKLIDYNIYTSDNPSANLKVGSSIQEVQAANGKVFYILGFEIDRAIAGTVQDWNAGRLDGIKLQFKYTKDIGTDFPKIIGDQKISSDDPYLQKAGLVVELIER